jgi:hypothetical protein
MENQTELRPRQNMNTLWGGILIVVGLAALLNQFVFHIDLAGFVWAVLLAAGSLVFFSVYLSNKSQWWPLIPSYVLAVVAVIIILAMLSDLGGIFGGSDDFIGIFVLMSVALPFYYVYTRNTAQNWWALIPAYVMTAVAGIVALSQWLPGDFIAVYIMLAIAFPFYYVYLRNRSHWWALIPAGIMTAIGLGIFTASFQFVIPIALIVLGLFLLTRQMTGGRSTPVLTGPEADKPK